MHNNISYMPAAFMLYTLATSITTMDAQQRRIQPYAYVPPLDNIEEIMVHNMEDHGKGTPGHTATCSGAGMSNTSASTLTSCRACCCCCCWRAKNILQLVLLLLAAQLLELPQPQQLLLQALHHWPVLHGICRSSGNVVSHGVIVIDSNWSSLADFCLNCAYYIPSEHEVC